MRLIDADVLKENLAEAVTKRFEKWDKTILVCEMETFTRDIINNTPTVIWCGGSSEGLPIMDLRPRPGAKWNQDEDDNSLTCSGCGCRLWANDIIDGEAYFCPNCGADMRKGGNE